MATQHSPSGMTAMQQIDSRPLTRIKKEHSLDWLLAGNL